MKAKKASFLILTTSCLFYCFVLPLLWISDMNVWLFREVFKGRRISEKLHKILYIVIFDLLTWLRLVPFDLTSGKLAIHAGACPLFASLTSFLVTIWMLKQHLCKAVLSAGGKKKHQLNIFTVKTGKIFSFLSLDRNPWQRFTCCWWSLLMFSLCHHPSLLSGLPCIIFGYSCNTWLLMHQLFDHYMLPKISV